MTTTPDLSSLRIQRDDDPPSGRPGRGRALAWVAGLLLALGAAAWLLLASPGRATAVHAATVNATGGGSASSAGISANGYVVARTRASVSAKMLGRLSSLKVHEGSFLRQNDIIATIDDADFQAQVAAARAAEAQVAVQIAQARRDLHRAEQLRAGQLNSESELEDAQTRLDALNAQLASAKAQTQIAEATLENTRVRAPFDGTVLRKDAEVGEIVAPSSAGGGLTRTAIVTMADLTTLEVEVDVNEAYIAQIRGGQPARITLDAYPDTSFSGRVRQVVPTADRQKATVQVKVAILDHDSRILPEMGAKVLFERAGQRRDPRRAEACAGAFGGAGAGFRQRARVRDREREDFVARGRTRTDRATTRSRSGAGSRAAKAWC